MILFQTLLIILCFCSDKIITCCLKLKICLLCYNSIGKNLGPSHRTLKKKIQSALISAIFTQFEKIQKSNIFILEDKLVFFFFYYGTGIFFTAVCHSVILSFCESVWNSNFANNFSTISARSLIYHRNIPCDTCKSILLKHSLLTLTFEHFFLQKRHLSLLLKKKNKR